MTAEEQWDRLHGTCRTRNALMPEHASAEHAFGSAGQSCAAGTLAHTAHLLSTSSSEASVVTTVASRSCPSNAASSPNTSPLPIQQIVVTKVCTQICMWWACMSTSIGCLNVPQGQGCSYWTVRQHFGLPICASSSITVIKCASKHSHISRTGLGSHKGPQAVAVIFNRHRPSTGLKVMTSTQIACGRAGNTSATDASTAPCNRGCGPRKVCGKLTALPGSESLQECPWVRWVVGGVVGWVCSTPQGFGPCAWVGMRTLRGEHGALQGLRLCKGTCCARGVTRGELGSERDGRSRTNGAQVCLCGRSRQWCLMQGSSGAKDLGASAFRVAFLLILFDLWNVILCA